MEVEKTFPQVFDCDQCGAFEEFKSFREAHEAGWRHTCAGEFASMYHCPNCQPDVNWTIGNYKKILEVLRKAGLRIECDGEISLTPESIQLEKDFNYNLDIVMDYELIMYAIK